MRRVAAVSLVVCQACGSVAHAAPCDGEGAEAGAPVRASHGPASFGTVPEACGAHAISLRGRMSVLIATDDFYGRLGLGGALRGRMILPGDSWISAELPGLDYRFVANATVEAETIGLSAATVGWHLPLTLSDRLQLAPYVRAMLPTETFLQNATRHGIEVGVSFVANVAPAFELMGGYALPLLITSLPNGNTTQYTPTFVADIGLRPWSWSELVVGAGARFVTADDDPLESLDPHVALRFYPWTHGLVDLHGAFPSLGRDRTLATVGVQLGWTAR